MQTWGGALFGISVILVACSGGSSTPPTAVVPPSTLPPGTGPVQQTVGAAGGKVTSGDGQLEIEIPAGALNTDTTVGIAPLPTTAPGGVGSAYALSPEGIAFAQPITLRFHYDDTLLSGGAKDVMRIAYADTAATQWHVYKAVTLDDAAKTVTVQSSHFSEWSRVVGFRINPPTADLQTGATLTLNVEECLPQDIPDPNGDTLVTLLGECKSTNQGGTWKAIAGTLTDAVGYQATYTAPAEVPPANPDAVSFTFEGADAHVILVSNIHIKPRDRWAGTIDVDERFTTGPSTVKHTSHAEVAFSRGQLAYELESGPYHSEYTLTSTNYSGCTTSGTKSGDVAKLGTSLTINAFPGMAPSYALFIHTGGDAIDGTSNCNDNHNVSQAQGIAVVNLSAASTSGHSVSADGKTINDNFDIPNAAGGMTHIEVSLTQK